MKNVSRGSISGFTLIELLVVVLIIGILSAVAMPQYQKTVIKARAAELQTIARSLITAQQAYFMANGEYADNLDNLDISFPFTRGSEELARAFSSDDVAINGDKYAILIGKEWGNAGAVFLSGPYIYKAGFGSCLKEWGNVKSGTLYCMEVGDGVDFCHKFYGGNLVDVGGWGERYYSMP